MSAMTWQYHKTESSSQQIAGTSITVMNKLKYTSLINVISSIIVFVLSYFCSIEYEVIGVCSVILLGNIVKIVGANIVYKNVLHTLNMIEYF